MPGMSADTEVNMASSGFFAEARDNSKVKAAIVSKYFDVWAKIIVPWAKKSSGRVAYIDLFAGPGRYEDSTISTPLLVLQKAVANPDLRQMLVTQFNDMNDRHSRSLEEEIAKIPGVETLAHKPVVHNFSVGDDVVKMFEEMSLVPTFFFVDPWGYKGLSLRLVNSVLKDWGCDCIFFFNYNRINMGLGNDAVKPHMDALFGPERGEAVRRKLDNASAPEERELVVIEELSEALRDLGGKFVLPFRFRDESGTRTSHHLIFVSKHQRGYGIMKDIMAKESSKVEQGVPSLEYNPADARYPLLFELARPLDALEGLLLKEFAGRTLSAISVYEQHNIGRPYIWKNYQDALRSLEAKGQIATNPSKRPFRNGVVTFAKKTLVTFPPRGA